MTQAVLHCVTASNNVGRLTGPQGRPVLRTTRLPALLIALGMSCSGTVGLINPLRRQRNRCVRGVVALSGVTSTEPVLEEDEDEDEDIGLGTGGEVDESELGPPPEVRYQGAMHVKDRKVWRAKAETMAKEKRLVKIQVGQLGITPSFLRACTDILLKHALVRVKLGEGCGLERRSAAAVLEKYLDCVCVHQIGFTITLYRQAGLPRPSNTLLGSDAADTAPDATLLEAGAVASSTAARAKEARKKAGQQKPEQRPPEFSVL